MFNINRNNYEEIYIDFLDGNLSTSEQEQLFLFLDKNPDLKEETELHDQELVLEAEGVFIDKKHLLKKDQLLSEASTPNNFNELCIAYLEEDLSASETSEFEEYLKESKKRSKEYEQFKATRIMADESVVFPDKSVLKKKSYRLKPIYYMLSAAASILVLLSLFLFLPERGAEISKQPIAEAENINNGAAETGQLNSDNSSPKVIIDKIDPIKNISIGNKNELSKVELKATSKVTIKPKDVLMHAEVTIEKLSPLQVDLATKNEDFQGQLAKATIYNIKLEHEKAEEEALSIVGFLASSFNKRVLKKDEKDRIELFDIAQAGVKGINKLTGSNMTLERKYNENGIPDKTEFASKLIAFSTPIKKD